MVGPALGEWHVMRATDGERFVVISKGYDFSGDLLTMRTQLFMGSAQFDD